MKERRREAGRKKNERERAKEKEWKDEIQEGRIKEN